MEKGADANILSTEGWHPLDAAHFYKHSKIAELLKDITQKDELEDPDRQASEMIQAHLEADQGDFKRSEKYYTKLIILMSKIVMEIPFCTKRLLMTT